jgi:hypothetical protein
LLSLHCALLPIGGVGAISADTDIAQTLSPDISMSYSHSTDAADMPNVERDLMPTIELEKEGDEGEGEKEKEEGEGDEEEEDEEEGEMYPCTSHM